MLDLMKRTTQHIAIWTVALLCTGLSIFVPFTYVKDGSNALQGLAMVVLQPALILLWDRFGLGKEVCTVFSYSLFPAYALILSLIGIPHRRVWAFRCIGAVHLLLILGAAWSYNKSL